MSTDVQGPDDIKEPVEETENVSIDLASPVNLAVTGPFSRVDTAVEVKPFFFLDDKENNPILDLRPMPEPIESLVPGVEEEEEAESPDPKDSSALESVESSSSTETQTTDELSESSASQDETVNVEKDSGKPKESVASGTQVF